MLMALALMVYEFTIWTVEMSVANSLFLWASEKNRYEL